MRNTTRLWMGALALSFATLCAPRAQATPDNLLIEPGRRIGRVFIGDTPGAVRRRLGKPTRTFKLGSGTTSELWRSGKHLLEVVYKRGKVAQIEATNPAFRSANDLGMNSLLSDWAALLGDDDNDQTAYEYPNKPMQIYYDWKRDGLAHETTPDDTGLRHTITIIVHRKGFAVIPDKGGKQLEMH